MKDPVNKWTAANKEENISVEITSTIICQTILFLEKPGVPTLNFILAHFASWGTIRHYRVK